MNDGVAVFHFLKIVGIKLLQFMHEVTISGLSRDSYLFNIFARCQSDYESFGAGG